MVLKAQICDVFVAKRIFWLPALRYDTNLRKVSVHSMLTLPN